MSESATSKPFAPYTVNLTTRSQRALDIAADLTGCSRTDTMNQALQYWAYVQQATAAGAKVYLGDADGDLDQVTTRAGHPPLTAVPPRPSLWRRYVRSLTGRPS